MTNKTFTQQRAVLRPNKNAAFFADDDDDEDDDDDIYSLTDDCSSSVASINTNADTLVLAQFLASTGPEEFLKPSKKYQQNPQFRRASRLFNRLRKKGTQQGLNTSALLTNASTISSSSATSKKNYKGTINSIRSTQSQPSQQKANYIPLPVYQLPPEHSHSDNVAIQCQELPENKNMPFLSHQSKPRHRNHSQQQQNVTPAKSTSSSSLSSHNGPRPSASRSSSSAASRRQLSMRDSGVYSDFSEKDEIIPPVPPPSLPAKSQFRSSPNQQPRRPAPLPASVASAAIASATAAVAAAGADLSPSSMPNDRRSIIRHSGVVPAAALKRRSVRVRHMQVQTDAGDKKKNIAEQQVNDVNGNEHVCSHCHQPLLNKKDGFDFGRRTSCPSVLPNGQLIPKDEENPTPLTGESKQLLEMIEQLKAQLAQEQYSRLQLEQAMSNQKNTAKKVDAVAREKDRWKGDCLWLNDRIALLPE
ncbi:unnamed protein product [Absidia cylindrospora]